MSFRPEQIEKEERPEDECDEDASEDVVGGGADIVIVIDISVAIPTLDEFLLVDVIFSKHVSCFVLLECLGAPLLDNADVPSDSETTQKMSANWYTTNLVRRRCQSLFPNIFLLLNALHCICPKFRPHTSGAIAY